MLPYLPAPWSTLIEINALNGRVWLVAWRAGRGDMMPSVARSVLYVRLPCWKIYPGGVVYIADHVHKQRPDVSQQILDLALVAPAERRAVLEAHLRRLRPDLVAFSWRNMQSFGPHPEDDALGVVMNFDYSGKLRHRLAAVRDAMRIIGGYIGDRRSNFGYFRLARRLLPHARIVVGGTAVSIFAGWVVRHCPTDTVVVAGEGEDAMVSIVDGFTAPAGDIWYKDHVGAITHRERAETFDLQRLTAVDFSYIASIFPEFTAYLGGTIGVHTKRGCPFQCHFCLYNQIEGHRQRYRDSAEVAREIETLHRQYGVRHIWFTDAQFCSTQKSTRHVEQILDEMIARQLPVTWDGYLRLNHLTPTLARKMWASGMAGVDLSFTGSQEMVDCLTLGYSLEQQMDAFRMLKANGHTDQKIKLYLPLNAPGETVRTLRMTIGRIEELYALFGRDNVLPFIFFIGVQPGTPVEKLLIRQGYLKPNYNPLTWNPFLIKRLLFNPPPLGPIIGRAYLEATARAGPASDYVGRITMELLSRALDRLEAGAQAADAAIAADRQSTATSASTG
jgi:radical SAM superfamily enzyme YgiQ (UPF0313 family)